jgi:hypothetical protein
LKIAVRLASVASLLMSCGFAQTSSPGTVASPKDLQCEALVLSQATTLSFKQRSCLFAERTFSKSALFKATFFSGIAQVRNVPYEHNEDLMSFGHRLGTRLAQNTSKNTVEYLVASLNHEDPRFHLSTKSGFWHRTESALLNTLVAHTDDGAVRPAFSKIAGALAAGFAGSQCYLPPRTSRLDNVLSRSGLAYGTYFSTAVFSEFGPDLKMFTSRLLHRHP